MRNSLYSRTLVLLNINLVVDLHYVKSVWFDYYNPQDQVQIKTYRFGLLFTFLEMFILLFVIVTVTKRKSRMLDWIIIILSCNVIFTIFTKTVYIARDEFRTKISNIVNEWNESLSPESSEDELDLESELFVAMVVEFLYCFGLVALKICSAFTIHRYRTELESSTLIETLIERNYPSTVPLPKPPAYELWYPSPSTSEAHSNDGEEPPPYTEVNEKY